MIILLTSLNQSIDQLVQSIHRASTHVSPLPFSYQSVCSSNPGVTLNSAAPARPASPWLKELSHGWTGNAIPHISHTQISSIPSTLCYLVILSRYCAELSHTGIPTGYQSAINNPRGVVG